MSKRTCILLLLILGSAPLAAVPARAQLPPDEMTSKTLPEPAPNWVFVLDAGFPSTNIAKLDIIDGDTRKMLGQLTGGYLANFEISPDHREMYMVDTYYSRGWHGTRTDVVSIFDAKSLTFEAEVAIPPKRILIVPKRDTAAVTPDGRFMLIANMTPATSVSVVDLKARKFAGEIDTPGCVQVLAPGNRQFSSMCADGSILTVQLDDAGAAKEKKQGKPFFDPNKDPVFDQPAVVGSKAYFDSYHGAIHVLDLSGAEAVAEPEWSVYASAKDKAWRPGGWQTIAYNEKRNLLFVLMHQGGEWTHKQFGTEVWVFDAAKQARVGRIKLKTPAYSIYVSNSDNPILYTLSLLKSQLDEYAVPDGKHLGTVDQLGTPFLVQGP
ncbi:MAG: amine dehydrogenase large subunit [Candidatus Binatus sp.]